MQTQQTVGPSRWVNKAAAQRRATWDNAGLSLGRAATPAPQQIPASQEQGPVRPTFTLPREARNLSLGDTSPNYKNVGFSNVRAKCLLAGSQTCPGKAHSRTHGALWNSKEISNAKISNITNSVSITAQ